MNTLFKITIKYSSSFNKINNILSDLDKLYSIVLNKVKDNNIFEIYYEGKIIYTFADDFNHHILTSDIIITKIKQYFSNHKLRKRPPNKMESDNIFLDEF